MADNPELRRVVFNTPDNAPPLPESKHPGIHISEGKPDAINEKALKDFDRWGAVIILQSYIRHPNKGVATKTDIRETHPLVSNRKDFVSYDLVVNPDPPTLVETHWLDRAGTLIIHNTMPKASGANVHVCYSIPDLPPISILPPQRFLMLPHADTNNLVLRSDKVECDVHVVIYPH